MLLGFPCGGADQVASLAVVLAIVDCLEHQLELMRTRRRALLFEHVAELYDAPAGGLRDFARSRYMLMHLVERQCLLDAVRGRVEHELA